MQFWQRWRKLFSKNLQICSSDSENHEKKIMNFSKGKQLSSKSAYVHVECSWDHPAGNFSSKHWNLFARIPEMTDKLCIFSKQKYFSSKCSSEHAQWNFGKPVVTLLPGKRKTFPNSKIAENTIFWTKLFFLLEMFL